MITIKNITNGPKGVHAKEGIVILEPFQELEVDMTADEMASSAKTGWFEGLEAAPTKTDALPRQTGKN